jgi:hypothetical protein
VSILTLRDPPLRAADMFHRCILQLWWSIWLTVVWGGWWAAVAAGMLVPKVLQATLVAIVPSMRQWIQIFSSLVRNVALILWTMAMWISFTPLV